MTQKIEDMAQYICTVGKEIHELVYRKTSAYAAGTCEKNRSLEDLSVAQMNMIMAIRSRSALSMTEISTILDVSMPSASAMVDRLVEKGVLIRKHSKSDRRKVAVNLSPDAKMHCAQIEESIFTSFVDLVEKIGPETSQKWCDVLNQVSIVLNKGMDTALNQK